ncbi:hypothetical protein L1D51_21260 [Pseudoalteromonas shioyasakiensis]|nr:hypothetical protein [Pseudoalteromonas shioyasakiensis]MCG9736485.1 hypothetical protein [Pseudoalteromonas shioyasakiensis]
MPPHPLNASLNHVISQGVENAQDAISKENLKNAEIELAHVKLVSSLLEQYLLHGDIAGSFTERLNDYWLTYKPKYIENAFSVYVNNMYVPWQFLDHAIEAHNYRLTQK